MSAERRTAAGATRDVFDETTNEDTRMTSTRISRVRLAALSAALLIVVLLPTAAWAHPFVRGGSAPVDSLAELTLAMAHGCGTEQAGGGDPTLEVAMEVPDGVRIVDADAPEGWTVAFEGQPVDVVVWLADEARDPAPELTFRAVFSGEPGDEVYLKVFQGCEGFSYRWIGTPEEPASDPAIRVRLVEADPSAPPPPEPEEPAVEEPAVEEPGDEQLAADAAEDTGDAEDAAIDEPEAAAPGEPAPEADADTDDAALSWPSLLLVALLVGGLSALVWWTLPSARRRR
jgi:hypothetical protein